MQKRGSDNFKFCILEISVSSVSRSEADTEHVFVSIKQKSEYNVRMFMASCMAFSCFSSKWSVHLLLHFAACLARPWGFDEKADTRARRGIVPAQPKNGQRGDSKIYIRQFVYEGLYRSLEQHQKDGRVMRGGGNVVILVVSSHYPHPSTGLRFSGCWSRSRNTCGIASLWLNGTESTTEWIYPVFTFDKNVL